MDADDIIQHTHLQLYADNADCDIVFQGWTKYDDVTKKTEEQDLMEPVEGHTREEVSGVICTIRPFTVIYSATWSKIFRRSIIVDQGIRFKEDIHNEEDRIFTTEYCAHAESIRVLRSATYWYRYVPKSLSNSYRRPKDYDKQIAYFRQAASGLYMTDELKYRLEQAYTAYYVQSCLMLYYPFRMPLCRTKRLRYLQACIDQANIASTQSSAWFLKGDARQTDNFHVKGYIRSCIQFVRAIIGKV